MSFLEIGSGGARIHIADDHPHGERSELGRSLDALARSGVHTIFNFSPPGTPDSEATGFAITPELAHTLSGLNGTADRARTLAQALTADNATRTPPIDPFDANAIAARMLNVIGRMDPATVRDLSSDAAVLVRMQPADMTPVAAADVMSATRVDGGFMTMELSGLRDDPAPREARPDAPRTSTSHRTHAGTGTDLSVGDVAYALEPTALRDGLTQLGLATVDSAAPPLIIHFGNDAHTLPLTEELVSDLSAARTLNERVAVLERALTSAGFPSPHDNAVRVLDAIAHMSGGRDGVAAPLPGHVVLDPASNQPSRITSEPDFTGMGRGTETYPAASARPRPAAHATPAWARESFEGLRARLPEGGCVSINGHDLAYAALREARSPAEMMRLLNPGGRLSEAQVRNVWAALQRNELHDGARIATTSGSTEVTFDGRTEHNVAPGRADRGYARFTPDAAVTFTWPPRPDGATESVTLTPRELQGMNAAALATRLRCPEAQARDILQRMDRRLADGSSPVGAAAISMPASATEHPMIILGGTATVLTN